MSTQTRLRTFWLAAGLLAAVSFPVSGQTPLSPRALGMGGAYTGVARGQEALYVNPANLTLADAPKWSLGLGGVLVGGTTQGPGIRDFYDVVLDERDARHAPFLAAIPDGGLGLDLEARLPLFTMQSGPFAVGVSYGAALQQSAHRDVVDLFVNGYEQGRFDYATDGTRGRRADYLDIAVGYAARLPLGADRPLHVGATVHMLRGRELARSELSNPRYPTYTDPFYPDYTDSEIEMDYREVVREGGRGFALDLGAAWQPARRLTVGAALTNALGRMRWNGTARVRTETTGDDLDPLFDVLPSEDGDEIGDGALETEALADGARPPRTLRLGAAWRPTGRTTLGLTMQRRLKDGWLAGTWANALGVGLDQRIPLLPLTLRGGYVVEGDGAHAWTAGVTVLRFIHAGLARQRGTQNGIARDGVTATVGLSFAGRRPAPEQK